MKKLLKPLSLILISSVLLSACSINRGVGGSWAPPITKEKKAEYIEAAEEYYYDEFGEKANTKGKNPIYFDMNEAALPANKEGAMKKRDKWSYTVVIHGEDDAEFRIRLDYDDMEIIKISETSRNGIGSYKEVEEGEIWGINKETREMAEELMEDLFESLKEGDTSFLSSKLSEDAWDDYSKSDIKDFYEECDSWEFYGATCSPSIYVDDAGDRTDGITYFFFASNEDEYDSVIVIQEILMSEDDDDYVGIKSFKAFSLEDHWSSDRLIKP